jgi:sigma-B regulation protein RsbU (phosphoserine phosphatase)
MAATIQNQLLPQKIPEVAGLGVYGKLSQARQVGGDFYIFGGQSGQGLIFAVGDVSGKGISSALMMAITRTVLHSHANTLPPLEAGEILTFANTDLYDDYTQVTMFATVFVGCYDPESRYLQFSNGGHSPVIYCPAGGKAQLLKAEDLPLGIFKDHIYKNQDITINPGDVLIVATDGFNEARNSDGDMFGLERLLSLAERNVSRSAQTIAEVMFARIHAFSAGHPQDDDATIVVIKGMSMPASERGHTS